jgi:protein-disulfide isomerase-like protein with CxxC motif
MPNYDESSRISDICVNAALATIPGLTEEQKRKALDAAYDAKHSRDVKGMHYANELLDSVNMSIDAESFAKRVVCSHPTIQQSALRLFFSVIETVAAQKYVDGRNERSVGLCKRIVEITKGVYIPLI